MRILFSLSVFALMIFAGDCFGPSSPPRAKQFFVINIDSVQSEPTITLGDTAVLRLWGYIGHNLCYGFDRYDTVLQPSRLDLTAWGVYPVDEGVCAQLVSRLYGAKFSFVPTAKGPFTVVIHQANESTLHHAFQVL